MNAVKEHGLLLSPAMVRARAALRKTQTRRAIAAHNSLVDGRGVSAKTWKSYAFDFSRAWTDGGPSPAGHSGPYLHVPSMAPERDGSVHRIYPRVMPGDGIWWKETYAETDSDGGPCIVYPADGEALYVGATGDKRNGTWQERLLAKCDAVPYEYTKKPSMFMPRWAARFQDAVTRVRVERIQEITEADAIAEGVNECWSDEGSKTPCWTTAPLELLPDGSPVFGTARDAYAALFDSINGEGAWERNEWVWVYEWELDEMSGTPGLGRKASHRPE